MLVRNFSTSTFDFFPQDSQKITVLDKAQQLVRNLWKGDSCNNYFFLILIMQKVFPVNRKLISTEYLPGYSGAN